MLQSALSTRVNTILLIQTFSFAARNFSPDIPNDVSHSHSHSREPLQNHTAPWSVCFFTSRKLRCRSVTPLLSIISIDRSMNYLMGELLLQGWLQTLAGHGMLTDHKLTCKIKLRSAPLAWSFRKSGDTGIKHILIAGYRPKYWLWGGGGWENYRPQVFWRCDFTKDDSTTRYFWFAH